MKDKLYSELLIEYMQFVQDLKRKNKDTIFKHAKEIYIKKLILEVIDNIELNNNEINKLLLAKNTLNEIYKYIDYSSSLDKNIIEDNIKDFIYVMREDD